MRIRLKVVAAFIIMGVVVTGVGIAELAKPAASQLAGGVPVLTNASAAVAGKPFNVYAIVLARSLTTDEHVPDPGQGPFSLSEYTANPDAAPANGLKFVTNSTISDSSGLITWTVTEQTPGTYHYEETTAGGYGPTDITVTVLPAPTTPSTTQIGYFVTGTNHNLFWSWTGHSGWKDLGGYLTSSPAAIASNGSRIDVYARGSDGSLWTIYTTNRGTSWSSWSKIGGGLLAGTGPAAYAL
jgi:hypothetical protein